MKTKILWKFSSPKNECLIPALKPQTLGIERVLMILDRKVSVGFRFSVIYTDLLSI
jgi:hypothetical protein